MERLTRCLEEALSLPVNREKSEVALMREVTFPGFRIYRLSLHIWFAFTVFCFRA